MMGGGEMGGWNVALGRGCLGQAGFELLHCYL